MGIVMRSVKVVGLLVLLAGGSERVAIQRDSEVILRCEDTTSDDENDRSACQWNCYRKCVAPYREVDYGDTPITGEQLNDCMYQLSKNCRLHGTIYTTFHIDRYCVGPLTQHDEVEGEEQAVAGTTAAVAAAPESTYLKFYVPKADSDLGLWSDTFSPIDVSLAVRNKSANIGTDECLRDSLYYVLYPQIRTEDMSIVQETPFVSSGDQGGWLECDEVRVDSEFYKMASTDNYIAALPAVSTQGYTIPLTNVSSALTTLQKGLAATSNVLVVSTPTKCSMKYPESIDLYLGGNFTLYTGVVELRAASATLAAALMASQFLF